MHKIPSITQTTYDSSEIAQNMSIFKKKHAFVFFYLLKIQSIIYLHIISSKKGFLLSHMILIIVLNYLKTKRKSKKKIRKGKKIVKIPYQSIDANKTNKFRI